MKFKVLFLAIIISVGYIFPAFAAKAALWHSKYDYAPVSKQRWRTMYEDKDRIIKDSNDAVTDAIYGVSIDGYIPGVIQLKTILKHDQEVKNPVTGKWHKFDTMIHRYLVDRKNGNYVYTMASISYYNKEKFLSDDDYPEKLQRLEQV